MSTDAQTHTSTPSSTLSPCISPSYITHQRRPALIPSDTKLLPEDEQSVRMRTGYVAPSTLLDPFPGYLNDETSWEGETTFYFKIIGKRTNSVSGKRKRSVSGDENGDGAGAGAEAEADNFEDVAKDGNGDSDVAMVDRTGESK